MPIPPSPPLFSKPSRPWGCAILSFISGALAVIVLLVAAYFGIRKFVTSGRMPPRQLKLVSELAAKSADETKQSDQDNIYDIKRLVETMYARQQIDPQCTMDFLLLSGGGDRGAFGTGFLLGWSTVAPGVGAMPKFQGVSGVSTGAFIAPFAFLGTSADLATVDDLFRNPKSDWVTPRGTFFFLPENASLATVPGLERDLRSQMHMEFAKRIEQAGSDNHLLLIQTTNIDTGNGVAFDFVAAARKAVVSNDPNELSQILLASGAVPGAFAPREIQGSLYVDGNVVSSFFDGGDQDARDSFGAVWKREHPTAPIPKTRYWVIINEYVHPTAEIVQPLWPTLMARSLFISVRSSEITSLRYLYAKAKLTKALGNGDVEVRWVAIPPNWKPLNDAFFDQATMRNLSDEGKRVGADVNSWMTTAP